MLLILRFSTDTMFKNILIALDGSAASERLIRLAGTISTPDQTRLHVLCAIDPGYESTHRASAQREPDGLLYPRAIEETACAEQLVADVVARLRASGLNATGWLCAGPAADTLVAEARRIGADLVVMGHRHLSRLERWAEPSTASAVVERAPCPVLVDAGDAGGVSRLPRAKVAVPLFDES